MGQGKSKPVKDDPLVRVKKQLNNSKKTVSKKLVTKNKEIKSAENKLSNMQIDREKLLKQLNYLKTTNQK